MHFSMKWLPAICIFTALTFVFPAQCRAVEDAIIAVVNDEIITLKELRDFAQSKYVDLVAKGYSDREIEDIMKNTEEDGINKLIENKLILSKALEVGLEVREELVDERIKKIQEQYGSEEKLVAALIANGSTMTDLKNKIRNQFKTDFIIDHSVKSKIYVNPQEVTDHYEKNRNLYSTGENARLESIFFSYSKDKDKALENSAEALEKVRSGEDFSELIRQYSDAPSIGTIERGQLLPDVEDIVFNLQPGQTSDLIEVDTGIFIFKLTEKIPAGTAKLEEVKSSIYDQLFMDKFKKNFFEWISGLKKDAYIEIK